MEMQVEELGGLKRKISVEVPLSDVETTYQQVYAQIKNQIKVKGFRPGKMPRAMVEKRFQDVMKEEATRSLLPRYFQRAMEEMKTRPATRPEFDKLEIEKSTPFRFEARFEIIPSFELSPVSDFSLEKKPVEVSPEEVDAELNMLHRSKANLEDKGALPAEEGDVVTVDFEGSIAEQPFQGNTGKEQKVELGERRFLPDFEQGLQGAVAGEQKSFPVTFPDNYGESTLAGKTAQFDVEVKKVEKKVLPPLDAEFYSQFGQFESLEAFKEQLLTQLVQRREQAQQQAYQEQLSEQIREKYSFEVPETLQEDLLAEFEYRLEHGEPEVFKDAKALAERKESESEAIRKNLRLRYFIDAWAQAHKLSATKEEVQQRFFMQAYMMQQNPTELVNSPQGEMLLFQIEQQIISSKVLGHMCDQLLGQQNPADAPLAEDADNSPSDASDV